MTVDELTLALRRDREGGTASEVILADGATTRIRSFDSSRQILICDAGREVTLARLERSGSIFFERATGRRDASIASYKGKGAR